MNLRLNLNRMRCSAQILELEAGLKRTAKRCTKAASACLVAARTGLHQLLHSSLRLAGISLIELSRLVMDREQIWIRLKRRAADLALAVKECAASISDAMSSAGTRLCCELQASLLIAGVYLIIASEYFAQIPM